MPDKKLLIKISELPEQTGVYLFKGSQQNILYVGKAINLRKRVRSYFRPPEQLHPRVQKLAEDIKDLTILLAPTEVEALLLERSLIRQHKPPYNVIFRDDKEYPLLRINFNDEWPKIQKVRRRKKNDKAMYLGPFSQVGSLNKVLDAVFSTFPFIRCSEHEFKTAKRPCNYYHMGRCLGPCTLPVDKEVYRQMVSDAIDIIKGKNLEVRDRISNKMSEASKKLDFEQAALFRDQIKALKELQTRQYIVIHEIEQADVIAIVGTDESASVQILCLRDHYIWGHESHHLSLPFQSLTEALEQFLSQYYSDRLPPPLIFIQNIPDGFENLKYFFQQQNVTIKLPGKKYEKKIMDMAVKNAHFFHQEKLQKDQAARFTLNLLKEFLSLCTLPVHIECIDISHIQGTATVASLVHFTNGKPDKSRYRIYNLDDQKQPDDFKSIEDVLTRRLKRACEEGDCPDLFLIDGGKGQLNAALKAMKASAIDQVAMASIAKSRSVSNKSPGGINHHTGERIFIPGEAKARIPEPGSTVFRLLSHLRDEAHRFAITAHRKKRKKVRHSSKMEKIKGVGPVLRKRLLLAFKSTEAIASASEEELTRVQGISPKLACVIKEYFSS